MFHNFFQRKTQPNAPIYRTIAISFFGISAVIAVIVFYISFSWATIRITPTVRTLSHTARATVQEGESQSAGAVPGLFIMQELEGDGTFVPSATEQKKERISGTLTVVNKTARAQQLRATTRFLAADGALFRSTEYALVPAGGSIDIPVQADREGELAETYDASRFTIPGLWEPLQRDIYGERFRQTQGGTVVQRSVTKEDLERAEQEILKKLEEKFSLVLDTKKPGLVASSVGALSRATITNRVKSHSVGETADEFSLRLVVRFDGVLYDEERLQAVLTEALQAFVSTGYELVPLRTEQYTARIDTVDQAQKRADLAVDLRAEKIRTADVQPYHVRDLAGLKAQAIVDYFLGYDDIANVSVSFYPFWVTRAPLLVDHIKIVVERTSP